MDRKLSMLNQVKDHYENNGNIIRFLKKDSGEENNSTSDILISYDFQAGSYIQQFYKNKEQRRAFCKQLSEVINQLGNIQSILEAGVGEAVTLGNTMNQLDFLPEQIYGFDLSWSRVKYAQSFLKEFNFTHVKLFTGDLFCAPIMDNSVDLIYTVHAIEPNGGREREALIELYRMTNKYLVLLEPAYELADHRSKKRMSSHGYITNLYTTAKELGYRILEYRKLDLSLNPLNPTALMVIAKDHAAKFEENTSICCPHTKKPLQNINHFYYSPESMLAYPILEGIPCLLPNNAIVATHYQDFL